MAIDPGIFAQANQPTVPLANPLLQLQQLVQTQDAINKNRLFQGTTGAGQAMQQAIDPATGQLDPGRLGQLVRNLPPEQAAAVAPALAAAATNKGQQLENQTADFGLKLKQVQAMRGTLATLSADPELTQGAVLAGMGKLIDQGLATHSGMAAQLSDMPSDPAALRQWARMHALQMQDAATQLQTLAGRNVTVDQGPVQQPFVERSAFLGGGLSPAGPGVEMGLSPSELARPTPLAPTATGAPRTGTAGQFLQEAGAPLPGPNRPSYGLPPSLRNPARAAPATAPGAAPGGAPGIVSGLPPAQQSALESTGRSSADQFAGYSKAGADAQSQSAILGSMLSDAQRFDTGMDYKNQAATFVTRQAPAIGRLLGIDPGKVEAKEGFDKLASQIANAQGAGSDARLAVFQAANPSSHLSPGGLDMIIRQLQGNSDYLQAKANLAASYPNKADAQGFESQIRQQLDPRAFAFDRMQPAQREAFIKGQSPEDQKQIRTAYRNAGRLGLLASGWRPAQ